MNREPKCIHLIMRKCPVCGEQFKLEVEHYWRIGTGEKGKHVCSYHCMRKWEKEHKIKRRGDK